ncbi:MmgE/PrpD family protein [Phenylobacterium sp. Root700]|uniref:MmgE/PrpD family protein n=1 Tax=Phenylobacterium sp. Root700 TaxID=1736591 RepID=UPI0009E7462B|nr:MmgE/PrpD family protein [Phenylobacterium sp. Root700]
MNPAEVLIDHALGLEWAALPEPARQAARIFLHDTLCVGVAGANAPYADAIRAAASGWGAGSECSVLGRPELRLPAPSAAFVNAFQIHSQEFDCVHEPAVVHPLATIASVLIAEAERSGPYGGEDLLTALAAGVDVAAGLGVAATTSLKFFRPATAGIFGCVAALARLRRLPRVVALDALGYALAFAGGTMQAHTEGKPALPVQIANAARGAITAVDVAVAGLPGPLRSIDGPFGYLTLFEDGYDLAPVLESLGKVHRIAEVSWKPFPTGRAAHGAIVATQALMAQHGLTADDLESLTYSAPPLIKRLVGRQVIEGMGPAHARLCFPYLAGLVLTRGAVGLGDFTAASLADPALHAIAAKISVEDNGDPDPAAFTPAVAVARTRDGRELRIEVAAQFGSPAWPLSREQHLEKARSCLAFGGLEAIHAPLAALLEDFEHLDDAAAAFRLAAGREP